MKTKMVTTQVVEETQMALADLYNAARSSMATEDTWPEATYENISLTGHGMGALYVEVDGHELVISAVTHKTAANGWILEVVPF